MKTKLIAFVSASLLTAAALAQNTPGDANAGPAMKIVVEFERSLKKYPPIAPGTPDPYTPPKVEKAGE